MGILDTIGASVGAVVDPAPVRRKKRSSRRKRGSKPLTLAQYRKVSNAGYKLVKKGTAKRKKKATVGRTKKRAPSGFYRDPRGGFSQVERIVLAPVDVNSHAYQSAYQDILFHPESDKWTQAQMHAMASKAARR